MTKDEIAQMVDEMIARVRLEREKELEKLIRSYGNKYKELLKVKEEDRRQAEYEYFDKKQIVQRD